MTEEWLLLYKSFIRKFTIAEHSVYSKIWLMSQARNMKVIPVEIPLKFRIKGVSEKSARAALEHLIENKVLFREGNLVSINPKTREWQIPDNTPTRRREYWPSMGMIDSDKSKNI